MNKGIVLCGIQQLGIDVARALKRAGLPLSALVSINEEKAIEQRASGWVDYEGAAKELEIPLYIADKYDLNAKRDREFFQDNKFSLLVQGVWQRLFPDHVLQSLEIGAVGVHGSSEFLPKGRGRSPINWSLIEGKQRFILHFFLMKLGVDDGDIFHYEMFDITPWDNCETLYLKNSLVSRKVLVEWTPRLLRGDYQTIPQVGDPTYYKKRTEEDGRIDWSCSVFQVYNFIRALTRPYPGAFCYDGDVRLKIWEAYPFDTRISFPDLTEGTVVDHCGNGRFLINCNSGILLVREASALPAVGSILT